MWMFENPFPQLTSQVSVAISKYFFVKRGSWSRDFTQLKDKLQDNFWPLFNYILMLLCVSVIIQHLNGQCFVSIHYFKYNWINWGEKSKVKDFT